MWSTVASSSAPLGSMPGDFGADHSGDRAHPDVEHSAPKPRGRWTAPRLSSEVALRCEAADRRLPDRASRTWSIMSDARVEFSVSTWQQPMPPSPSPERARVLDRLVDMIDCARRSSPPSRDRRPDRRGQDEPRSRAGARARRPRPPGRCAHRSTTSSDRGTSATSTTGRRARATTATRSIDAAACRLLLDPSGPDRRRRRSRCAASIRSPRSTTRR